MPILKYTRGTGFKHWFWQNKIAENLRSSDKNKVTIEANLKGKFVDILVEQMKDDREIKIAIEISITSTSDKEKDNIIKDLESGVDSVIAACPQSKKLQELNQMIASLDTKYREKTFTCLLPELLKRDDFLSIINSENLFKK